MKETDKMAESNAILSEYETRTFDPRSLRLRKEKAQIIARHFRKVPRYRYTV